MSESEREIIEELKEDMLKKRNEAEKAAYAYCCACDLGDEREKAFQIYENIRNATRLY